MRLNLKRLGLLAGKAARVFAQRAGLTPQRLDLMHLASTCALTQSQLAERLCVSRPVVSRMLKALEQQELVSREPDPKDRRTKVTRLTTAGLERLRRCIEHHRDRGAQATGEAIWLDAWRHKIGRLGLRVDSILRARPPRDFHALALWNLTYVANERPTTRQPPADDALRAMIQGLGLDYETWLRGEWQPVRPPE